MSISDSYQALNENVIINGFCIGCAVLEQSPFKINMDEYGQYKARLSKPTGSLEAEVNYEKLCPFGDGSPNETELAKERFESVCNNNIEVGYYNGVFAGHVSEGSFRKLGSSGGMCTWMLNELLEQDLVDYIVHVKSEIEIGDFNSLSFSYQVSESLKDTKLGAKSRYYPIEMSKVLRKIRNSPGRYAVIGLPCFIKSIRLLQKQEPVLEECIKFCVGLVCGHQKSARYAERLAWQVDIDLSELQSIDFRVKDLNQPVNRYSTSVKGNKEEKTVQTNQLIRTDWGGGAFKYKFCDFCDDVFAETANVVLGDTWLSEHVEDSEGTNIVITRNSALNTLVENALNNERLLLDRVSIEQAIKSQDVGLRHRKVGIVHRLDLEQRTTKWVPSKREPIKMGIEPNYERKKQKLRMKLRALSHESFSQATNKKELNFYLSQMKPVILKYKRLGVALKTRFKSKDKTLIRKFYNIKANKLT
ncbi:Coenzyme F420 hydrogenase/dehydrogenase, beta subunit C-terminal domain [Vreelandella sp. V005]|uniref:Coenzyme F420 hydrogenase/dehydrogenase, beta subunit C-terminal domain n=1 Tax=Vreelandella sp. V005 TaxID=3459608 RepID=UPI0040439B76